MYVSSIHSYPVKGCYRLDHDSVLVEPWGIKGDRRWAIVDAETGRALTQRDDPRLTQVRPDVRSGRLVLRYARLPELSVTEPVTAQSVEVTVLGCTVDAASAGKVADDWLTTALGRAVRLVWQADPTRRAVDANFGLPGDTVNFADGYPLLLANQSSLDALNEWITEGQEEEEEEAAPLPMTRFRPNVVIAGAPPWAEDDWLGRRLRLGDLTVRAVKSCGRCVVTTTDQESGVRGREPLRTLSRHRREGQRLLFGTNLIPDGAGRLAVGSIVELIR